MAWRLTTAVNSSYKAAEVYRGAFNNNGFSGLNFNIVTDQSYGGTVGSYIRVERAIGKRNGQSGLAIRGQNLFGYDDEYSSMMPRGINVDIIRGVYNSNDLNGIFGKNLSVVNLDGTTGNNNKDNGFDGNNIANVINNGKFRINVNEDFSNS